MILKGMMPIKNRQKYWMINCNIKDLYKNTYYDYVSKPCNFEEDISKDLDRTFAKNHHFYSNPENKKRLNRVLKAFAVKNSDIGYIQGLNFLAGNLVLIFPEQVLNIITIVCLLGIGRIM